MNTPLGFSARVTHGPVQTEVCCVPVTIDLHTVTVTGPRGGRWQFQINPRVNTPARIVATERGAIAFVAHKLAAQVAA